MRVLALHERGGPAAESAIESLANELTCRY
jgi:hypothetical protein